MSFLDKARKTIGGAATTATEKAKDFAETTKLNNSISSEEKQINEYFSQIGRLVFEQEKDNPESPFAETFSKITESMEAIQDLKTKISEIKKEDK